MERILLRFVLYSSPKVMVGILATVLLQSSSTTTSIVVGLVGADGSVFNVEQGIYLIMGANIGTTITNTIVSLLQFQNQNQLADAFAGATIHDLFNFLTVAILSFVDQGIDFSWTAIPTLLPGLAMQIGIGASRRSSMDT